MISGEENGPYPQVCSIKHELDKKQLSLFIEKKSLKFNTSPDPF